MNVVHYASLRQLARRADVAVEPIYNYFPDKDDLIKALFQREWSRTIQRIMETIDSIPRSAPTSVPVAAVITTIYDVENIVDSHPGRRNLAHHMSRSIEPYPLRTEGWQWLCVVFEPVWRKAVPHTTDCDRLTVTVVASVHRLALLFPDQRENNITFLKDMVLSGGPG